MATSVGIRLFSKLRLSLGCCLILCAALPCRSTAADPAALKADAEEFFRGRVTPFINTYCIACHQNRRPTRAGVNFSPTLKAPGHAAFTEQWKKAAARVKAHDMPPKGAPQPNDADRQMFAEWMAKLKYLSQKDPGPFIIRRLTKTEYGNTLRDLFGVDPSIADGLPEEVSGEGYLNSLSALQLEQYLKIADKVLGSAPSAIQKRLFGKPPVAGKDSREAARNVARSLATKAYRRPPTPAELDKLLEAFDMGRRSSLAYQQSLHLMVKAILVSPQFLFITPVGEAALSSGIVPLDDYQLASRLSYLLWATMPDDELMALAEKGALHQPAVLDAQVLRLLKDPRSRALFDGFGAQWLGVGGLKRQVFDSAMYPQMTAQLRMAMYDEARLFFESIVRENKSILRFVDGDYTYLNGSLAPIYGLGKTITGPEMRRVKLSDGNRGGILGMPGVLAGTSFPNRTSPVKRGVWVLEQVLGDHVPAAPPNVPALDQQDQAAVTNLTVRERTELHRTNPVCANCHKILDPIGFGLENFDAIGQWRDRDSNGKPIDAAGELPGGERFSSPKDLKAIIAGRTDALSRNLVEKLLAYALGRRLEGYDEIVVDDLTQKVAEDGYRMQTLIKGVVTSYPFTNRRIGRKEDLQ
jgi:mono/diheme cytochrome c family protein